MFNIVLLEPEIPFNTGNIGRTCLVTGSRLHLIEPMGFILNDKNLKRAGMDYWADLDVTVYDSWRDFVWKHASDIDFSEETLKSVHCPAELISDASSVPLSGNSAEPPSGGQRPECTDKSEPSAAPGQQAEAIRRPRIWMATTKARQVYDQADFRDGDYIMFGKESAGIPEEILLENPKTSIRIPMASGQRSLNLSNSAAVILYEALRQNHFPGLEPEGQLHRHTW